MSLLVTVLESYGSLVAGRIGNPMLTKEDYDQIDAEEMELMDINWCLASVLRRTEKFKQITGRDDFRKKGHFKRECTNREASGAQNPFGNHDYYRKAIYHQVAQQPYQQQTQPAHALKEIEESKKAYLVNQDDERSSKGFSWDKYISAESKACLTDQDDERLPKDFSWDDYDPNRTADHKAFVAKIIEDSADDNSYWADSMKEHLEYLADRDAEKARMAKKKVEKQDDRDDDNSYYAERMKEYLKSRAEKDKNDDEEVCVIKKQDKEILAFEIKKEVDIEKVSENCENCETMKKHNNELIHNMNRLKESYDVLNKAMNQYNESSSEQATAMKTLNGAYMIKKEMVNYYIDMCAELEQKLETQRIEAERVNKLLKSYSCSSSVIDRIYPIVEGMKAFEEETYEAKNSKTKEDTEEKNSGKKHSVKYNKCPPPLENGYSPRNPNSERVKKATNL
ncbi:hypothetical protein HanRHA438_Chr13g0614901 [Helianthus annuus]|nr:hypothetical protein HanRHA438_Chr13g0614901 [Helianthus annuus]